MTSPPRSAPAQHDEITQALVVAELVAAVAEMKAAVLRAAYSNLWREAGDLSCGILTRSGEIVMQGTGDIPIHLASMPESLKGCFDLFAIEDLSPGDVLLQNDPYRGNNHLPDCIMAKPVFVDGQVIGFSAIRGHYVDIGSAAPGSYFELARDIYGEGLRIPPVKLYRSNQPVADVLNLITANVRNPTERIGDMRAQFAGCYVGEQRLISMCERFGVGTIRDAMERHLESSEARARAAIREVPDGTYEARDFIDDGGDEARRLKISVSLTVADDTVTVDFAGTDPQSIYGLNAPRAVTLSATYYAIKSVTEPHTASNSGSYRPITVHLPDASVINPRFPAPVVAGNHETATRIADVVLLALSQAVPDRVPAAGSGGSFVLIVSQRANMVGTDDGDPGTVMYEVHGAGQGANANVDGSHARRTSIGNTGNTPNEMLERAHSIRVDRYEIATDGGGAGRRRGGCSILREITFTADCSITVSADRTLSNPYGLMGGRPGRQAVFSLHHNDGSVTNVTSKAGPLSVTAGEHLCFRTAGGGGYGPPEKRSLAAIQSDIDDGYVTPGAAGEDYHVSVRIRTDRADGSVVVERKPDELRCE